MKFSLIRILFALGALTIFLIAGVTVLIAFTDIREYIPGYPSGAERRMIMNNLQRTDSLMLEVQLRDAVLTQMRQAISGQLPLEAFNQDSLMAEGRKQHIALSSKISEVDSLFRASVEAEDRYNVAGQELVSDTRLEMMFLFPPVKGIISNKFGDSSGHFGVDVLGIEGTRVSSILDGTVLFAEWTVETGNVLVIQHDNQIISIYKHNSKLFKKAGDHVLAGEAIAIMGNSGEFTTGPHLHFELWYSGVPLDPENYISFD